jgi:hypothetical protein
MRNILILLLSSSVIIQSCDFSDRRLKIVNKTGKPIALGIYSDTLPSYPSLNKTEAYLDSQVSPGELYVPSMPERNGWEKIIYNSPNKKLNIFVFKIDSLKKYRSIDSLIRNRIYNKISISEDSLQNNKWTIHIKWR